MPKQTEKVILAIILLFGAVLRIYNYWDFSLSNDELSALARLNFISFNDLIQNGVRIDGHPPAAQIILYYITKLFGNSVAVIRFPFLLAGIASIYFMYKVGKEWVSSSTGMLAAATFATLSFPILYSRIARPYALGMLFCLMAMAYWIRIVKNKGETKDFVLLALALALCAYSHYFSAMVAAILALTGTFLITGKNLKAYLLALVGAFILFVPYVPIFLHQLGLGGVGQWLGPPQNDWLFGHINYIFNDSWLVQILILATGVSGFILFRSKKSLYKNALPLLLFLIPFLIGFLYSKYVDPVLQHSTLLFSFPFLLVFVFSGWDDTKPKITAWAVGILIALISFSTIVEKRFYNTDHFGVFKELAEHLIEWNRESNKDALLIGDFNYPFYLHYYTDRIEPTKLDLYRTTDEKGLASLKSLVNESEKEFLIYGWSTVNQSPEVEAIIQERFPIEINRQTYFNSEIVRFQKGELKAVDEEFPFEKTEFWNCDPAAIREDSLGQMFILISNDNPYGPTYTASVSALEQSGFNEIFVRVNCTNIADDSTLQMVYEQLNENGGYSWESDEFKLQFQSAGPTWGIFQYSLKASLSENDVIKIYPWLPDGGNVELKSMSVSFR